MKSVELTTLDAEGTRAAGARLGRVLLPGDVIALSGELGSGKTVFVQGLARGVDTDSGALVTSPSFVILNEYPGRLWLYHFDFYRLGEEDEVLGLGYEEYFEGNGVCAVEWADKFPEIFGPGTLWIRLTRVGDSERVIEFRPGGGLSERWKLIIKALDGKQ